MEVQLRLSLCINTCDQLHIVIECVSCVVSCCELCEHGIVQERCGGGTEEGKQSQALRSSDIGRVLKNALVKDGIKRKEE
jgi:hypothetical protein